MINARHNYEFLNAHFFNNFHSFTPTYLHTQLNFIPSLPFEKFSSLPSLLVFSAERNFTSNQITFQVLGWTKLPETYTYKLLLSNLAFEFALDIALCKHCTGYHRKRTLSYHPLQTLDLSIQHYNT